jgi:hypothetical protein
VLRHSHDRTPVSCWADTNVPADNDKLNKEGILQLALEDHEYQPAVEEAMHQFAKEECFAANELGQFML